MMFAAEMALPRMKQSYTKKDMEIGTSQKIQRLDPLYLHGSLNAMELRLAMCSHRNQNPIDAPGH